MCLSEHFGELFGQLRPRADAELGVSPGQVGFDGVHGYELPLGDLLVGEALRRELRGASLRGGELSGGPGRARGDPLDLGPGPPGPAGGPDVPEFTFGFVQRVPGTAPLLVPAKGATEREEGAGPVEPQSAVAVFLVRSVERLAR